MELTMAVEVACPHCGEVFSLTVDTSEREQTLVEDCSVCCQPITLTIRSRPGKIIELSADY
ncbi:MAG: CPXCG motif-containing cysteine-rich protein [Verrucomicrobia bacterium]|nr:CPXCG motif-containing cysteine-rich protein [Verrucomicrobiota bacterium]